VAGSIFATESHPGACATGTGFVRSAATLGRPVVAIGGITAERAPAVHAAGAHGIAAMRALWDAPDAVAAAEALLAPWREAA
jgi:thiamine-phosphate pyrophosphorylase